MASEAHRPGALPERQSRQGAGGTSRFGKLLIATALVAALAAGGVYIYLRTHRTTPLDEKDTIVLADFANSTGDPVLADALTQALAIQLEQSPFLALVSEEKIGDTLKLMGKGAEQALTLEVAQDVCLRTGSKVIVAGSIEAAGAGFAVELKAVGCKQRDVMAHSQAQAAGKVEVLAALDDAVRRLRPQLGESLGSVEKAAAPETTGSLEALQAYGRGRRALHARGEEEAMPFFQRAVELDPGFALPYVSLAVIYRDLGRQAQAQEAAQRAFDRRDALDARERLVVAAVYHETMGDLEKAVQAYDLWQRTYPRNSSPLRQLSLMATRLGDHQKALAQALEAFRKGPRTEIYHVPVAIDFLNLNRFKDAEIILEEAQRRGFQGESILAGRYQAAFLKSDGSGMIKMLAASLGNPGAEDLLLALQADTEAWHGRLRTAGETTRRAIDSARRHGAAETAAAYLAVSALRELESGNARQAVENVKEAMQTAPSPLVSEMAAIVFARTGDTKEAQRLAADLERQLPVDTLVHRYWLPSIRAAGALAGKDPKGAVEFLKESSSVELSAPTPLQIALIPAYLRGQAFLMQRDGKAAAAEFQKFDTYRGLVGNFPLGALARLHLARASAMDGQDGKARVLYQSLLTIWNQADPDLSVLQQARAELDKLQ